MRKALREQQDKKEKVNKKRKVQTKKLDVEKLKTKFVLDRKNKTLIVVLCLAVIVLVACKNYTTFGLVINKNITDKDATIVELQTTSNEIIAYGDEVLVCNKGNIDCYAKNGNLSWNITLSDMVNAEVYSSGKYIQIVNKDKNIVYVYKNKYEVARIKTEGEIYSTSINEKGISVIEYATTGNKTALAVYDNDGDMTYNVKLGNKIIGKYIISDNMKYLAYIDVNISGISAHTTIQLIDFDKITKDNTNAQTIHTIEGALAYDIYFSGKKLVICEEDSYTVYNLSSSKKDAYTISDSSIENIAQYKDKCAFIKINPQGESVLSLKSMKDVETKDVIIESAPKYLVYQDGIVYIAYQKKILAYNNLGMKIKEYSSNTVITEPIVFNDGKSLAMTISNELIMFTI